MRTEIAPFISVVQDSADQNLVHVTMPSILTGRIATVTMKVPSATDLIKWLRERHNERKNPLLVQDAFPTLSNAEREFLLTGITEGEWNKVFPTKEKEDQ